MVVLMVLGYVAATALALAGELEAGIIVFCGSSMVCGIPLIVRGARGRA